MLLFSQLREYFATEWRRYGGAVSLLIVVALLQLLPPRLVGIIVDGVTHHSFSHRQLAVWIVAILAIAMLTYLLRYVWRVLLFGAAYRLAVVLREKYYRQLSQQSPEFYLNHRTGDLLARATNDVDRVVFAAGEGVLTLIDSLVMGLAVLVVMSTQISWQLTLIALLPMPLMAWIINRCGKQLHQCFRDAQAAFSSLNDQTQESLTSIRMIKSFGLEDYRSAQFLNTSEQTSTDNLRVARVDSLFEPVIYLAVACSNFLAIAGGGWMVWHQQLTLGQLTSFVMYLGLMIWPMLALAWMFNIVERGSAAWIRIEALLSLKPAIIDGKYRLSEEQSDIQIDIRQFIYPQSETPVLQQVSITIPRGAILGVCGPTGSGKSTLLALIQRHFDITDGEVRYQSQPLPYWSLDDWRQRLAVVSQAPFLFSDTIANNIALGNPHASPQQITRVAQIACVDKDIQRLPDGYNTQVGERGVMLSGGQKQRISLARALLMDAEILILDDALSAVDGGTEHQILTNLRQWLGQRTVIITAHRLSALAMADEIVVLQNGKIAQRGPHLQLEKVPGWYREMYQYQKIEASLTGSPDPVCEPLQEV
ncbi:SmdA family multidrug ABC transporter permease/ATP-binding protein [Tatumella citrea]|uniref:Multidrug resistance-like ATP-binding protein MdlA n=1 Tax=Tatumella citrea TaxID=53336 RepID=A0A1Y0L5F1_TATCI|nr:SmdA family multidrug ABC transporter permease/ATP-binding protein [Tatumella citrea]ARU93274.1 multidrug ABC transporter permease/ATP-binding protein [Tatumella citrea]ARU97312.1 multidrug ABC transporter permease/ATP-binding protein [Tatumella citrea]